MVTGEEVRRWIYLDGVGFEHGFEWAMGLGLGE